MISRKQKTILSAAALCAVLLLAQGCAKEKTCRCTVRGTAKVRVVKIEKGRCEQLSTLHYHTDLDSLKVDSLLCTDFDFAIDSIYNE